MPRARKGSARLKLVRMRRVLLVVGLAGAADTVTFAVSRRRQMIAHPERAAGSLVGLILWLGLATSAARQPGDGRRTLGLAVAVTLANAALLGGHLAAGVRNPRALVGPSLAATALGAAALNRSLRSAS